MEEIAIIGISGRFPGAKNIEKFWQNLRSGVESISLFTDEELIAAGIEPGLLNNSNYVKAGAILEDIDLFDAAFFGFNPKEAEITDPQHRLFLECAWEALENAGYDSQRCESRIGVYAGASLNNYLSFNINRDQIGSANSFQKLIGNDKDFLTTRVSYKLNLSGPSVTIQTACSTSLVAITLACQSLLNYQCDMTLAGGVSIRVPQKTGYLYQEGGILSPDGHCRAFDAKAQGTIIGNGVGVVVLKRLADAIADGDHIYAVIKAAAINNDGYSKIGYTAPSVNGQEVKKVKLYPPKIPFISNVTGTWITPEEATDPNYWAKHLRFPVRFSAGISQLLQQPNRILLEVGPGRTLCTLAKQHSHQAIGQVVLPSLRHPQDKQSDVAFILNILGRLWLAGVTINWSGFYAHEQRQRVPLPTYPFERQRYWIEPQLTAEKSGQAESKLGKKPNIADWFYVPSWKQIPLVKTGEKRSTCYLVFVDECTIGSQIVQHLQQTGQDAIAVLVGAEFSQVNHNTYTINPTQKDDYYTLLQTIHQQGKIPETIIHFWSLTHLIHQSLETIQNHGFWSLIYLAQALGQQNISDSKIQLFVVSNHLYDVTGNEELLPAKATILGPCKVIPQEYPGIKCRQIDVVLPTSRIDNLVQELLAEITAESNESIIAYRNHHRWVQVFEPITLEKPTSRKTRLRQKGVYLITGGTGGIGLEIAKYLAQTVQAKLILIGRSQLPAKEHWQQWLATHDTSDPTHHKIQKLQELETLGAEVLILPADVTNYEQMQSAVAQSLENFGEIHGVIHAAGVAGSGIVQLKTLEIVNSVFAPKLQGTLVLNEVLQDINLDFLVLCSSLSSIYGGFGQVDYCAANAFLDKFAHFNTSKNGKLTLAINWDTWQEVGMAVNTAVPEELKKWRSETLKNGLLPTEAVEAFERILANPLPQILVSTQELQLVIDQFNQFLSSSFLNSKSENFTHLSGTRHARTLQETTYVAPRNEIEQSIANIWEELIGIDKVGIYDKFFELGGHSLLAVQTISRLRETFQVDLPLRTLLFEAPTVAELAIVIAEKQPKAEELKEIEQLLAEVENLSLDEIKQQLAQESQANGLCH
ncbi:SDR family NAD(P)-dependent oxidoreductase [Fischerella thermalis]|uniref:SDR family NAD(P)-dependent oxidoreductase n=1 Tax=Fischerella thermalis TaxID=372787 RepID=UPI000C80C85F|nr:SDR family NAD(P)-dependent oxidoreductase [Fischerella thermalis]PLZ17189.1 hypothetical protein CBP19_04050 [Fischerella thermalis WC1110]PLZ37186.1 hypothetical protein CBP26_19675 [Fischerella thermalis WC538]PLZ48267.1 hypothetical protein CBP25_02465 [Fischerella thermalis WC527]